MARQNGSILLSINAMVIAGEHMLFYPIMQSSIVFLPAFPSDCSVCPLFKYREVTCLTETLTEYNARVGKLVASFEESSNAIQASAIKRERIYKELREMFDSNSFIVLDDEEAQAVLDSASMKGIYKDILHSLTNAYTEWREKNPEGKFVVPITGDGTAFGGKNTDTVYQGVTNALKGEAFQGKWRLIRRTKDDVTTILIAAL